MQNETQLPATPETLQAISDLFEQMEPRAREIFDARKEIDNDGVTDYYSRVDATFDDFRIEDNMITLRGSHYDRCDGNQEKEYYVSFENFFDPDYLEVERDMAKMAKAEREAKKLREEALAAQRKDDKEREEYARLKEKFDAKG